MEMMDLTIGLFAAVHVNKTVDLNVSLMLVLSFLLVSVYTLHVSF